MQHYRVNQYIPQEFDIIVYNDRSKWTRHREKRYQIKIGPVITNLKTPEADILEGETLDPYSDEFDIQWDWHLGDWVGYDHGSGYGLEMNYTLHDKLKSCLEIGQSTRKALITVENLPEDELEDGKVAGDMGDGEKHYLVANESALFTSIFGNIREIKWEGFSSIFKNDFGRNEKADKVFMEGKEAKREVVWGLGTQGAGRQTHKGASLWSTVGEGCYKMKMNVKRRRDESQKQKFEINLEVKVKPHDAFFE